MLIGACNLMLAIRCMHVRWSDGPMLCPGRVAKTHIINGGTMASRSIRPTFLCSLPPTPCPRRVHAVPYRVVRITLLP